jgi:hypothetical protein
LATAGELGEGVINESTSRLFVNRTTDTTDVLYFNPDGTTGTVSGMPHRSGRFIFIAQNPANLTARRLLGLRQLAAGLPAAAIETMEGVKRRLGSRDAILLAALSRAYAADGRGQDAVRYGRAAYALAPLRAEMIHAYATALAASGNDDGARQLRVKLAAIVPDRR